MRSPSWLLLLAIGCAAPHAAPPDPAAHVRLLTCDQEGLATRCTFRAGEVSAECWRRIEAARALTAAGRDHEAALCRQRVEECLRWAPFRLEDEAELRRALRALQAP